MVDTEEHPTFGHHVWYFGVFGALCVLTVLSVVFDLVDIKESRPAGINGHVVLAALVLSVATAKALFVMMYFMHLKFEGRWKYLLLSPTIILAIGLPLALLPDIGAHYYTTDVPQNAGRISAAAEVETTAPAQKPD